jgi:DNA-binding MarR family transcriptional regulator
MADEKFGVVHTRVIHDPDLSLRAKGLYALLATYADKDRICYPMISTLAEISGVSRRTIERTLIELEEKKYVKRTGRVFKLR